MALATKKLTFVHFFPSRARVLIPGKKYTGVNATLRKGEISEIFLKYSCFPLQCSPVDISGYVCVHFVPNAPCPSQPIPTLLEKRFRRIRVAILKGPMQYLFLKKIVAVVVRSLLDLVMLGRFQKPCGAQVDVSRLYKRLRYKDSVLCLLRGL